MRSLRELESRVFDRVNPAVSFSVTRYVLAIGIFVAIVVFGLVSMLGLGVDLLPAVNIPSVQVVTSFPGATPEVVDQQITQTIENVVSTVSNISDLNASSSTGSSRVSISFDPSVDRNAMANQIATLVSSAARRLPTGAQNPVVQTFDPNSQPILQFGIAGGGASLADVADYVNNTLTPILERVNGVANIQVDGAPTRQYRVLLDTNKLSYYGLTPQQVVSAMTSAAVNTPVGTIETRSNTLTFTTLSQPADLGAVARTLVDASRGLTVADLGAVRAVPTASNYVRVDGMPQILVTVQRTTESNAVAVVDAIRAVLDKTVLPPGYSLTVSNDTTGPIRASVEATYRELAITAIVVALVVLLFLGKLNTAFSVILAIPIALSAAPILYRFAGFSFNLVSLLALIIAIGIVVDDSIVVAENVERYRAMGLGLKESVLKGASEVFSAVIAASLSLLSVLLPVSFVGGFIGRYLQQFSLGLAAAVALSLLEAILFLTVRLAYTRDVRPAGWGDFLRSWIEIPQAIRWAWKAWRTGFGIVGGIGAAVGAALLLHRPLALAGVVAWPLVLAVGYYVLRIVLSFLQALTTLLHGWTEAGLEWLRSAYTRSLGSVLRRGAWVLGVAGVFLTASAVFVLPRLPFSFVPQNDTGTINVSLRYPNGTPGKPANDGAGRIEAYLLGRPEVATVQTVVGGNGAQVTVRLTPVGTRASDSVLTATYRRDLQAVFRDDPAARVSAGGFGGGGFGGFGGGGSTLQLNLAAADYDVLLGRNDRIIQELQTNPWIADVSSSLSDVSLQNAFVPDPAKLEGTGITPTQIAQTLQTYASGSQASSLVAGGLSYPIRVGADPRTLSGGQSLLNLPIYSPTLRTTLQIGQLGSLALRSAPVTLSRSNRQYTGQLTINLKPGAPPALTMQNMVTDQLTQAGLIGGEVTLTSGGRFSQAGLASQLSSYGPRVFLLAVFLAYLVMAAQFNSWRYPVYLLLPVPLALVGALWLVYLLGGGLDVFGLMGLLMLIGLSAKNAILYLDFVVERIGKMPFRDALIEAARLRFRPIVMTTLTVLVISFPLIFSHAQGSEFGQRMGIVMLGGVLFSAVLTFFVVPAAFYLFERKRVAQTGVEEAADGGAEAAAGELDRPLPPRAAQLEEHLG